MQISFFQHVKELNFIMKSKFNLIIK
jgi:hypothetical protein